MNLLASSASRWRIGRKEAAPTSLTAHRLAGFAEHVGQDGEVLCQFIVPGIPALGGWMNKGSTPYSAWLASRFCRLPAKAPA